jgi:predicted lipoprotein with Yx(FWY)xxD motif
MLGFMRKMKTVAVAVLVTALLASPLAAFAGEKKEAPKAKPYPLKTCVVSGEKLEGDTGMKTYTFVHEGQEVKLCCKSCLKDFKKDPARYMKKIQEAQKAK